MQEHTLLIIWLQGVGVWTHNLSATPTAAHSEVILNLEQIDRLTFLMDFGKSPRKSRSSISSPPLFFLSLLVLKTGVQMDISIL